MRISGRMCAALVVGLILLAGAAGSAGAQGRRDAVVLLGQEPADLFPGLASALTSEGDVVGSLTCGLVRRTDTWTLEPDMATRVPSLKNGDWQVLPGGKMRVTYRLKPDWRWHDGRPVTAADFVWTARMRKNPRTPVVSRFLDDKIDHASAPNPRTVVFQYNKIYPYADLDPFIVLPSHILAREYNRDPSKIDRLPYGRAPIHCGPYRFKRWVPGSFIEVVATPETYGGPTPKINAITFRFVLDPTVLAANLIAGRGDATGSAGLSIGQIDEIARHASMMRIYAVEGLVWEHIDFNLDHEWLRDRRVRQAIAHAIDRESIARNLFLGRQPVAHTFLAPRHFAHNPNVRKYAYDPARARHLLAEAGFTPGPDGVLWDRAGRRLELSIMTTAGEPVREQVEEIMREQLRQVGIDLKIDNRPATVLFGQIGRFRAFPHMIMFAWVSAAQTHFHTIWHSHDIPTPANNYVGQNVTGYRSPTVDRLLDAAGVELDEAKRRALLWRLQDVWAEDLPSIPLFFRLDLQVARKTLQGYRPRGIGNILWNAEQWAWSE